MERYFNIRYEFERGRVHEAIAKRLSLPGADYICVADGVILNTANRDPEYLEVVNGGMFSICDSGYVPLYIRWIYGRRREQYTGSQIFRDIVSSGRYRMYFLGTSPEILSGLRDGLSEMNPAVKEMTFSDLPFRQVEDFDYEDIAADIERDGAEIVWVALGAPKQERFMALLKPHLKRGVMIAVGAAFKFYSGTAEKRAPEWMVRNHMEFLFRIYSDPGKQLRRCARIVTALPGLFIGELKRKRAAR